MGANKPIEDIEATLLAATKSAWMSSSGGPTRRWQRRPLKRHFGVLLEELDGLPSSAFVAKAFTGAKLVKAFNHLVAAPWLPIRSSRAAPGHLSVERRLERLLFALERLRADSPLSAHSGRRPNV